MLTRPARVRRRQMLLPSSCIHRRDLRKGERGGGGRGRISSVLAIDLVAATRATERNRRKAMPQNQRAAACGLRKVAKKDFRKNGAIECRVLLAFIC